MLGMRAFNDLRYVSTFCEFSHLKSGSQTTFSFWICAQFHKPHAITDDFTPSPNDRLLSAAHWEALAGFQSGVMKSPSLCRSICEDPIPSPRLWLLPTTETIP